MNIFFLHDDYNIAAREHCDKHVVKMIVEYTQLLSTAHRVLDGILVNKKWILSDITLEDKLYKPTHIKHPSAVWVRCSIHNYVWLYNLLGALLKEYNFRYEKIHKIKTTGLYDMLKLIPKNIPINISFTYPPLTMNEECKMENDVINSYKKFYIMRKYKFATWKKRPIPNWFIKLE